MRFVFQLAAHRFACDFADVRRVVPHLASVRVPGAPEHLSGVAYVDGRAVPVLNLRALVRAESGRDALFVLWRDVAFGADAIVGLSDVSAADVTDVLRSIAC